MDKNEKKKTIQKGTVFQAKKKNLCSLVIFFLHSVHVSRDLQLIEFEHICPMVKTTPLYRTSHCSVVLGATETMEEMTGHWPPHCVTWTGWRMFYSMEQMELQ